MSCWFNICVEIIELERIMRSLSGRYMCCHISSHYCILPSLYIDSSRVQLRVGRSLWSPHQYALRHNGHLRNVAPAWFWPHAACPSSPAKSSSANTNAERDPRRRRRRRRLPFRKRVKDTLNEGRSREV